MALAASSASPPDRWRKENLFHRSASVGAPREQPHHHEDNAAALAAAHMQEVLRRNLGFASLRITIQTGLRAEALKVFRAFRQEAAKRRLDQLLEAQADSHLFVGALLSALICLQSNARRMHVRWSRAVQHERLMSLMTGLMRWRAEFKAARRKALERRQWQQEQHRVMVLHHARLLLWEWRYYHGSVRVRIRKAASYVRGLRAQPKLLRWKQLVRAWREEAASLAARSGAVRARLVHVRLAWLGWAELAESGQCAARHVEAASLRVVRRRLGRGVRRWRRACSRRSSQAALTHLALAHSRDAPRGRVLHAWGRQARLAALQRAYRRRGWRRWLVAAARRRVHRRLIELVGRGRLYSSRRRVRAALRRWAAVAVPRRRLVRVARRAALRRVQRRRRLALTLWCSWSAAVVRRRWLRHAALRASLGRLLRSWCRRARQGLQAALSMALLERSAAVALRDRALLSCCRHWLHVTAPSAALAKRAVRFVAMMRWRRGASGLFSWRGAVHAELARRALVVLFEARHCSGLRWRWHAWRSHTARTVRHGAMVRALRARLLLSGLESWLRWREALADDTERSMLLAAAAVSAVEALRIRRLSLALDAWSRRHESERAKRARLAGRRDLLIEAKARVALIARWAVWRHRAFASSRANRWITLAAGHCLLRTLAIACHRWRSLHAARHRALAAMPSPLVSSAARAPPLPPPPPPPPPAVVVPSSRTPSPPKSPLPRLHQGKHQGEYRGGQLPTNPAWSQQPRPLPPWRAPELSGGDLLDRIVVMHQLLAQPSLSPPALHRSASHVEQHETSHETSHETRRRAEREARPPPMPPPPVMALAPPLASPSCSHGAYFRGLSSQRLAREGMDPLVAAAAVAPGYTGDGHRVDALRASFAGELLLQTAQHG